MKVTNFNNAKIKCFEKMKTQRFINLDNARSFSLFEIMENSSLVLKRTEPENERAWKILWNKDKDETVKHRTA